jgi:hypothetical protein
LIKWLADVLGLTQGMHKYSPSLGIAVGECAFTNSDIGLLTFEKQIFCPETLHNQHICPRILSVQAPQQEQVRTLQQQL